MDARIRTATEPAGLPFATSPEALQGLTILNMVTAHGELDLTFTPTGTHGYPDLQRSAARMPVGRVEVLVASLADVIRSKTAAGRAKDFEALPELESLHSSQPPPGRVTDQPAHSPKPFTPDAEQRAAGRIEAARTQLAAAVSGAGALGCLAAGSTTPVAWVEEQTAVASGGPFGIGLLAWALSERPELVEAALAAQRAGVDVVLARGGEGGGHGRNEVATLPLLQGVLDAVSIPVLAAGGIATARRVAAVLAAGAAGAWVGTAFLACPEAETSPQARARLLAASSTGTAYGRVFDVGLRLQWPPEHGGRSLRNAFYDRWEGREDELARDEEAADELREAVRLREFDTAVIYAGQAVGLVREQRTAVEIVAELARAEDLLRAAAGTDPA